MKEETKYVGLDVHKVTIAVAVADGERGGEVPFAGTIADEDEAVRRFAKRLGGPGTRLEICYEAGPCGYGLQRYLGSLGHSCIERALDDATPLRRPGKDRSSRCHDTRPPLAGRRARGDMGARCRTRGGS